MVCGSPNHRSMVEKASHLSAGSAIASIVFAVIASGIALLTLNIRSTSIRVLLIVVAIALIAAAGAAIAITLSRIKQPKN